VVRVNGDGWSLAPERPAGGTALLLRDELLEGVALMKLSPADK
jgi:hypothetical protein